MGWRSSRSLAAGDLTATGAGESVQVVNVPGAGGTVGLAQFVNNGQGRTAI